MHTILQTLKSWKDDNEIFLKFYTNKFDDLDYTKKKVLERVQLLKLTQEGRDTLSGTLPINEHKFVIKSPRGFTLVNSTKCL